MVVNTPEDPFVYYAMMEEELDTPPAVERQRPPNIEMLFQKTKFSRSEIQYLYRTFKEVWPNGTVVLDQFQSMYASIFPNGNSKPYAELVFRNIDQNKLGTINFLDFVVSFSKIAKGNLNEKLGWIFSLYDSSCSGSLGYNDIHNVVRAMYQLADSGLKPFLISTISRQHVKLVMKKLKMQPDSRLKREEFITRCIENVEIMESFEIFGSFSNTLIKIP